MQLYLRSLLAIFPLEEPKFRYISLSELLFLWQKFLFIHRNSQLETFKSHEETFRSDKLVISAVKFKKVRKKVV